MPLSGIAIEQPCTPYRHNNPILHRVVSGEATPLGPERPVARSSRRGVSKKTQRRTSHRIHSAAQLAGRSTRTVAYRRPSNPWHLETLTVISGGCQDTSPLRGGCNDRSPLTSSPAVEA